MIPRTRQNRGFVAVATKGESKEALMKKTRIGLAAALMLAWLCGSTMALGDGPVNPYHSLVRWMDQRAGQKGALGAWLTGVTFTERQAPSLTQTGIWDIHLDEALVQKHGEVTRRNFSIQSVDPTGNYSTEYLMRDAQTDTMESCAFVAPGTYRLAAFYYLADGESYAGRLEFTVEEDGSHPTRAEKVASIVAECTVAGDQWQTALNLHDWLTHHAYYDYTYSFYGAEDVLMRGYGVCDSYAKAYQFLLDAAGIDSTRVTSENHAWNVVQLGGEWFHIDTTWDDGGKVQEPVSGNEDHDYFCINDELIYGFLDQNGSHQNGASLTGRCHSLAQSYPIHTGEWRDGGQYRDGSAWGNYLDLILSTARGGAMPFTVNTSSQNYPISGTSYYGGTASVARMARYYYAYGLNLTGLTTEDGHVLDASVAYDLDDMCFTVSIHGWKDGAEGTLDLPENLAGIEESAFEQTDAGTALVPENCLTIGDGAFRDSALRWIEIPNPLTALEGDPFDGCGPLVIVAPQGSAAAAYAEAHGLLWWQP